METTTPKTLVHALDLMTREEAPQPEALGPLMAKHYQRVRAVFEDPNIIAIGISEKVTEKQATGQLGLSFYVVKKLSKRKVDGKMVPSVMALPDGTAVFTDVKQIGRLVPQANFRKSPIQSGFSVGHFGVTAGTIGAIVRKQKKNFILSNCHVLALSGKAKVGDKVLYPGKADGGALPKDGIATLSDFAAFDPGDKFANRVDAALAEIDDDRATDINFKIFGARGPLETIEPVRGMTVVKRGRTSGDTESTIQDVHFRVILDYAGVGKVGFLDQVLCDRFTSPGDSGAIIVEKKSGKIVGLHFAGASGGSVFNPIGEVIKALKFKFADA